jgi:(p)ppGpp synthase/HD superfamily hydrolase
MHLNIAQAMKELAEKAHAGQFRKWSNPPQPYIVHPIRVAEKVATLVNVNDIDIGAAYGHDILEDCGEHYADEIERIHPEVLSLVKELTFPTENGEWVKRSRAEKNVIRFEQMRRMTPRAKRIKMVDRWDNLLDMKNAPYKLIHKTVDESYTLLEICRDADLEMAKELANVIERVKKGK